MTVSTAVQERDRAKIPDQYKWNLADLYADDGTWRQARTQVAGEVPALRRYRGRLGESAAVLAEVLALASRLDQTIARLYVYASMRSDEDTRVSETQGMQQEMQQLYSEFGADASFIEPEILALGQARLEDYLASEPRLAEYAFHLRDVLRRAPHTLSDAEERILAEAGPLAGSPSNIYGVLANADFPYPTVRIGERDVRIDQATYVALRASADREERRLAMSSFFTAIGGFRRTYGTTINAEVQRARFYAKSRRYASDLEAALDGPNIPTAVYTRLIDGVGRALPTFHRYLRLRRRMLRIEGDLHYYDLYAPLVADVNLAYSPEDAQQHILASLAPLGPEYVGVVARAFAERWIDFYPTEGKTSGAYSNGGAYDVHPFILLNFLGQYNDVSTMAHELGHTMHSYYSNRTQPYPTAGYQTFVAEVASTFNEALLLDHMLSRIDDTPTRLSLLGNYLEGAKATVFRQTQFAEFELRMHEMAERGEALTGDSVSEVYSAITRKYYGHDQAVCVVDDYIANEWAFIPHFYRDFYVFQYATSFTAAEALSSKVLSGDGEATRRYLAFISSGGSNYPIDLLKEAGVDMTTPEPLDLTIAKMNSVMDEIEGLLSASETAPRRSRPAAGS